MIYLKFNEEKKKAVKIIEEQKGITPGALNGGNDPNDEKGNKFNELDKIDEEDEENQDSEEFDIFDDDVSSKGSQNTDDSNEEASDAEKDNNPGNNIPNPLTALNKNNNNNANNNANNFKINNVLNYNNMLNNEFNNNPPDNKRTSFLNSRILENNLINNNNNILNNNLLANMKDDSGNNKPNIDMKGIMSGIDDNNFSKILIILGAGNGDKNDDKDKKNNLEINDQVEKIKNQMNKKFLKKVDKIIEFLDNNSIQFADQQNNPLDLLKKLRATSDIYERNDIIDKIEGVITELFKNQNKQ